MFIKLSNKQKELEKQKICYKVTGTQVKCYSAKRLF